MAEEIGAYIVEAYVDPENLKVTAKVDSNSLTLLSKGYGLHDLKSSTIAYNPIEALYLLENNKMILKMGDRNISFNEFLALLSDKDEDIWMKYVIYRDLRKRRYTVKEGFGNQLKFRVFERGEHNKEAARYLVTYLWEGKDVRIADIKHLVNLCRGMRKDMVIAVIDRRNEIVYYRTSAVELKNV